MKLDSSRVVGTEVGLSLVHSNPFLSLTRDPGAPHPVATGRHWPRSTFRRVLLHWGSHADDALNPMLPDAIALRRQELEFPYLQRRTLICAGLFLRSSHERKHATLRMQIWVGCAG